MRPAEETRIPSVFLVSGQGIVRGRSVVEWRPEGGRYCEGRTEYAQALSSLSFADDFSHVWFGGGGELVVQKQGELRKVLEE